jgi:3-deoxy-D-manno-octulosonic-acid transferase
MSQIPISVFIAIYSGLFEVIRKGVLPLVAGPGRRRGWNIIERQKLPYALRDHRNRTVVWVHAASLGETKLLLKFLEIIEQRHPDDLYVLTATTQTGVRYLERNKTSSVCAVGFLPFDTVPLMRAIIQRFRISRVWLMETEIWPSMLWTCRQMGIPVGLVNARVEEKSYKSYMRMRPVLHHLFGLFDLVLAQNESYAQRFADLGVRREAIHVVGNIKGHIMIKRPNRGEWLDLRNGLGISESSFVLTAGCMHAGEGAVIRRCLDLLAEMGHSCRCIIVPRHMDDMPGLLEELGSGVLVLDDIRTAASWDICLINRVGILEEMYKVADAAIVGGTFVEVGGHNVWEPARFGIPVFFGPDYHTQVEGCERLMNAGVGFKADDAADLASQIYRVVREEPRNFINAELLFMETVNKSQSVLEPLIP